MGEGERTVQTDISRAHPPSCSSDQRNQPTNTGSQPASHPLCHLAGSVRGVADVQVQRAERDRKLGDAAPGGSGGGDSDGAPVAQPPGCWSRGAVQCPCYIFSSFGGAAAAAIDFMTLECNIGRSITRSAAAVAIALFFVVLYV